MVTSPSEKPDQSSSRTEYLRPTAAYGRVWAADTPGPAPLLVGTWEAQTNHNAYQIRVSWNPAAGHYEGRLVVQGYASRDVGFPLGELCWTATPSGNPATLGVLEEQRSGRGGRTTAMSWQHGVLYLDRSTPAQLLTSSAVFRRVAEEPGRGPTTGASSILDAFPSADEVRQKITGRDPLDTAARQFAALKTLADILNRVPTRSQDERRAVFAIYYPYSNGQGLASRQFGQSGYALAQSYLHDERFTNQITHVVFPPVGKYVDAKNKAVADAQAAARAAQDAKAAQLAEAKAQAAAEEKAEAQSEAAARTVATPPDDEKPAADTSTEAAESLDLGEHVFLGHVNWVKDFIKAHPESVKRLGRKGGTVLGAAVICESDEKSLALVQLLLAAGADPNQVDAKGEDDQPLMTAVNLKNKALAKVVLANGANPSTPSPRTSAPPLLMAVALMDLDMLNLLLKYKPDLDAQAKKANVAGISALHLAVTNGTPQMVEALLKAGADVNARAGAGESVGAPPAHLVVYNKNKKYAREIAVILKRYKADLRAPWHELTPAETAKEENATALVPLLTPDPH